MLASFRNFRLFCSLIGLLFCFHGKAQNDLSDLFERLGTVNTDSSKVDLLNSIAWRLRAVFPDSAMDYLKQSEVLSKELKYTFGNGKSISHQGTIQAENGDVNDGITLQKEALEIYQGTEFIDEIAKCYNKIGIAFYRIGLTDSAIYFYKNAVSTFMNPIGVANTANNLAIVFQGLGRYREASEYFQKAAKSFEELGKKNLLAAALNNTSMMYAHLKEYDKARPFAQRGLQMAMEAESQINIAQSCGLLGTNHLSRGNYDSAKYYILEARRIYESLGAEKETANTSVNLGSLYYELDNFRIAKQYTIEAIAIFTDLKANKELAFGLVQLGDIALKFQNLDSAKSNFLEAESLVTNAGEKHILLEVYDKLANVYQELGDLNNSLKYEQLYSELNESLLEAEQEEIEAQFQSNQAELDSTRELADLKSNQVWKISAALVATILILTLLIFKYRKSRRDSSAILEEKLLVDLKNNELHSSLEEKEKLIETLRNRALHKKESLPEHFGKLSKREVEVLILLGEGLKDEEVADRLFVSVTTIRTHNRRIYEKLLLKNRAEAVNLIHKYDLNSISDN